MLVPVLGLKMTGSFRMFFVISLGMGTTTAIFLDEYQQSILSLLWQIHIDGHDGSSFRVQTDAGTDVASDGYLIDPRDVQSVAMNDQLWKVLGLDHGVFEEPIDQRAVIGDGRSAGQRDVLAVVDEHLDVIDALRHRAGPGTTGSTGKGVASVNEEATGGAR